MVLNAGFDVCLRFDVFAGWDVRWVMALYGLLFFLWVLALAGLPNKTVLVALALAEFGAILNSLAPSFASLGSGREFWNATSTAIVDVWLVSIFVTACSVVIRGTVISKIKRGYAELLIVPKQRFLVPIAIWSGVIMLPYYLQTFIPQWLLDNRFMIASQLLVWGWVAFELPFYIMYKRMPDYEE